MKSRPTALLKRALIFAHRWLGVALALLFMLWFVSGIVMMYWSFPEITAEQRLARALTLTPEQIAVSPEQAYEALQRDEPPTQVRLTSIDGRPVYQFGGGGRGGGRGGGSALMVFADDGTVRGAADDAMVDRAAARWANQPIAEAKKESVEAVDQWTVAGALRTMRPLYKYSWPDGQQVYVNGAPRTSCSTRRPRRASGPISARSRTGCISRPCASIRPQWFSFVVWSSGIGTVSATARRDRRGLDVLAAQAVSLCRGGNQHPVSRLEAVAHDYRARLRRFHDDLGVQRAVVDGAVPDCGKDHRAHRAGGSGARGAGRDRGARSWRPRWPRPEIAGALRGASRFQLAAYAARTPAQAIATVPGFPVKELESRCLPASRSTWPATKAATPASSR